MFLFGMPERPKPPSVESRAHFLAKDLLISMVRGTAGNVDGAAVAKVAHETARRFYGLDVNA